MKRILVISPHPDDDAIGCGGAILKHAEDGDAVKSIVLTSGEKGGHGLPPDKTIAIREKEAAKAAGILGVSNIEFWRLPDGAVSAGVREIKHMREILRSWKPARIYVPHPGESHSDHRAAARIAIKAVGRSRLCEVLFYEVWTPLTDMDLIIDITPHLKRKLCAIRAHRTQCNVLDFASAFRGLARYRGEMFCWPEGDYAEVFARYRP